MLNRTRLSICIGAAFGATLLSSPALAQDAQKLERVEVTGSRIKTLGAVSNSPITSVGKEEINASQPMAIEEVVRSLPASYPAIGPGTNNGSGGIATIDLRGLGPQRTLVLINGRRMVPSDLNARVDTNTVPVALLERVDIVTGGASAVYGADAVAGVVNFVTKKNFAGVEASASYGISEKGDAARFKTDFTLGVNAPDGNGNLVLAVGRTKTDPLTQGERDYGFYQINSATGDRDGSGTAVPPLWVGIPGLSGARVVDASTGLLRAATAADNWNFNPANYYETPLERTQFTALGNYRVNDNAEFYAELFHTKSKVTLNLAASGTFTSTYSIPIGNPFIPQGVRNQLCTAYGIAAANCVAGNAQEVRFRIQRRFTELGPRINDFDNTLTQYTVGVKGDIPGLDWNYDAYLQRGTTDQVSARVNWGSFSKVQQALRATNTTTCTVNTNGCVPINPFGPEGSMTTAMLNFINLSAVQTTYVVQDVAAASVSGEVGFAQSPFARAPLNLAIGLESREVKAGNRSDGPSQIQGEVLGTGAPTPDRKGSIKLKEAYVEGMMPLVEGATAANSLNLELGYRQTKFETEVTSKDYGSWKAGLDWSPIKGLRFRGMQQRATRAPNVNELYAPVITGLANLSTDPCQGNRINVGDAGKAGTLTNLCQQTGVPQNQIGQLGAPSAGQINSTGGGNLALGPEEADTTTLGLVFEPESVKGLTTTLDFYRIKIKKAVSSPAAGQVVDGCFNPTLNPGFTYNVFCQNVQRDAFGTLNGSGSLGVVAQLSNLGTFDVSGVDLGVNYRLPLSSLGLSPAAGRVDLGLQVSYMDKWDNKALPSLDTLNCAGYYSTDCGNPYPKVRFSQRATWMMGDFTFGYNWRHISKTSESPQGDNAFVPEFRTIKAYDYLDLSASWKVTKHIKLALAINNALDKDPPMVGNTIGGTGPNSGNTFPQTYDVLGRRYNLTVQANF
ncbi:MAG: TonB-dependent receptor [Inhella sp.]